MWVLQLKMFPNDAGELQNPREFQAVPEFVTQLQEISQTFNIAGETPTKVKLKSTIISLKMEKPLTISH